MISKNKINLDLKIPVCSITGEYKCFFGCSSEERINTVFNKTLTYKTFVKGRSSIKFVFNDCNNNNYEMFLKDFSELIRNIDVSNPIEGQWAFVKRGANYGIVKVV